jgi:hypothetical protein
VRELIVSAEASPLIGARVFAELWAEQRLPRLRVTETVLYAVPGPSGISAHATRENFEFRTISFV